MAKTSANVSVSSNSLVTAALERRAQITNELNVLNGFIAAFGSEASTSSNTAVRRGRPTKKASGKRGRPKGSKNKPTTASQPKAQRRGKAAATNRRGRPKGSSNGMSLLHAVAQVLASANEPLKVAQIVEGVAKLGYNSKASSFNTMVSQTLGKLSEAKVAKTTARGVWESANGISKFLESLTPAAAPQQVAAEEIPV